MSICTDELQKTAGQQSLLREASFLQELTHKIAWHQYEGNMGSNSSNRSSSSSNSSSKQEQQQEEEHEECECRNSKISSAVHSVKGQQEQLYTM